MSIDHQLERIANALVEQTHIIAEQTKLLHNSHLRQEELQLVRVELEKILLLNNKIVLLKNLNGLVENQLLNNFPSYVDRSSYNLLANNINAELEEVCNKLGVDLGEDIFEEAFPSYHEYCEFCNSRKR